MSGTDYFLLHTDKPFYDGTGEVYVINEEAKPNLEISKITLRRGDPVSAVQCVPSGHLVLAKVIYVEGRMMTVYPAKTTVSIMRIDLGNGDDTRFFQVPSLV